MTSDLMPSADSFPDLSECAAIKLRILETTDVHSNLMDFDYYRNQGDQPYGLVRTASLIHEARQEVTNSLLFDNGDFLQGTPLSDQTAQPGSGWPGIHPAIEAMNALGYDAATVGNHEFNFGLDWLENALEPAGFPVTCANAVCHAGARPTEDTTLFAPYLILPRQLVDADGQTHLLHIGVIGLVPPQITSWDQAHLAGKVNTRDIVETARAWVPEMRAKGADIVVALAHTGFDTPELGKVQENAAMALSKVDGIDAILAGHTHQVFPSLEFAEWPGVDALSGTINNVPTVLPGMRGSHLGVIDLTLHKTPDGWSIDHQRAHVRPVDRGAKGLAPIDEELRALIAPAHAVTLEMTKRPIGTTKVPLHSYLSMTCCNRTARLIAQAQRSALTQRLAGTPHADLPVVSAAAPFKLGGRAGAQHYTDIPKGPLSLRNAADIYPFPNTLCALRVTGAHLLDWLERAAVCFAQLRPNSNPQMLVNPDVPGNYFDVIEGLTYEIDLSQPARYDHSGALASPSAHRIRNLQFGGLPIDLNAEFILATNNYRAFGAGPYADLSTDHLIHRCTKPIRDLLARYITEAGPIESNPGPIWQFAPLKQGTTALFDTGPGVMNLPEEIAALGVEQTQTLENGFARLQLPMWKGQHIAMSCESVA